MRSSGINFTKMDLRALKKSSLVRPPNEDIDNKTTMSNKDTYTSINKDINTSVF